MPTGGSNAKAIELTEKMMGHAGYLGGTYSRVPLKELADFYQEAEHTLWINQPVAVRDPVIEEKLERARKENEDLRSRLFEIEANQSEMKVQMIELAAGMNRELKEENMDIYMEVLHETMKKKGSNDNIPLKDGTGTHPTRGTRDRST